MTLWDKIVLKLSKFETLEEYEKARARRASDSKLIRKRITYIVGTILFYVSLILVAGAIENHLYKLFVLPLLIGHLILKDTLFEYYTGGKSKDDESDSQVTTDN
jgi:hypothetical protein